MVKSEINKVHVLLLSVNHDFEIVIMDIILILFYIVNLTPVFLIILFPHLPTSFSYKWGNISIGNICTFEYIFYWQNEFRFVYLLNHFQILAQLSYIKAKKLYFYVGMNVGKFNFSHKIYGN